MSGTQGASSLSALLRAQVPPERLTGLEAVEGLETLLRGLLEAGKAAWPTVTLAPETFVRHLARHLPGDGSAEVLRQLHGADLYLACACAMGERQALLAFEQHVLQKVPARLGQIPASTADEVLQVMRQRLLLGRGDTPPKIADYSGRGPLLAWVRIIGVRIVGELASQDGRQELFNEPPETLARMLAPDDPERELLKADSRQALVTALRTALAAMPERERAMLRLHHIHGLTMDRLATMYGEPRSSVARRVVQARERLLKLTRGELASRLKLEGVELESLLGLVRSRLDLSLNRLMD
ncbi:sigma factor-like helix-turn-helix DNA-binding protein [Archangium lansingense]|uniref:RNA polymerase subunit sigma-70 n=1 Tax=Archangium lansingense TaxID=2995310 RepID=A0ABT4AFX7_9BACT|nr:sigma factor-like helix-turn-helix DNA-binding protein [Archangium lansinium]MCY1079792.1 RNA polymerase subunit sigma-70 [Archangium lansinium]